MCSKGVSNSVGLDEKWVLKLLSSYVLTWRVGLVGKVANLALNAKVTLLLTMMNEVTKLVMVLLKHFLKSVKLTPWHVIMWCMSLHMVHPRAASYPPNLLWQAVSWQKKREKGNLWHDPTSRLKSIYLSGCTFVQEDNETSIELFSQSLTCGSTFRRMWAWLTFQVKSDLLYAKLRHLQSWKSPLDLENVCKMTAIYSALQQFWVIEPWQGLDQGNPHMCVCEKRLALAIALERSQVW